MKNWLEKYSLIIGIVVFLGGVAVALINWGKNDKDKESRMFDTNTQKFEIITRVKQLPTPLQQQRKMFLDSLKTRQEMKTMEAVEISIKLNDSLRKKSDSINKLNAVQMFQIKKKIDSIEKKLKPKE